MKKTTIMLVLKWNSHQNATSGLFVTVPESKHNYKIFIFRIFIFGQNLFQWECYGQHYDSIKLLFLKH